MRIKQIDKIMEERKENFEQAYKELNKEDKKELNEIGKKLEYIKKENPNFPIRDKNLKKRIAKICLKLIEKTPKNKILIMETSYIIAGNFVWFNYEDKLLDEVIEIAGDLEVPEQFASGDVFKKWNDIKNKLRKYLLKL